MAHQGIREFTSEELSGVALGQNGFKVISNATVILKLMQMLKHEVLQLEMI